MVKAGDEYHYIHAYPAKTIDATGAGDTYAAGFIYGLSLGMPLEACGKIGSKLMFLAGKQRNKKSENS